MSEVAKILKIYVGENAHWQGQPLYRAIVMHLKANGCAGVTVIRGVEGYGKDKIIHTNRLLELSADLPMVIECIDTATKIASLLPEINTMVTRGLVFTSDVEVHKWG
ncbi:MAG: DUF190 domain-containing protein [Peptococcaceae bacterium]|nr:DUF190 domain-containing protein [Peptococcaceae bacterium]